MAASPCNNLPFLEGISLKETPPGLGGSISPEGNSPLVFSPSSTAGQPKPQDESRPEDSPHRGHTIIAGPGYPKANHRVF